MRHNHRLHALDLNADFAPQPSRTRRLAVATAQGIALVLMASVYAAMFVYGWST